MRVLVGCEVSGKVRDAFIRKGHDAWSCDIEDTDVPGPHFKGDVLSILDLYWDLAIFFPPCTYLCSSGLHWNTDDPFRRAQTIQALRFVQRLFDAPIKKIALENPVGRISTHFRKPNQIIQPYQFGHDASKKTCLWLKNLPKLPIDPAKYVAPRIVGYKERWRNGALTKFPINRWANQTDSGQNRLGPSSIRAKQRSETYQGIADAMAETWG